MLAAKTHRVTPQALEAYTVSPPPHLAPMAGKMQSLRAAHQAVKGDLAMAEHDLRAQERRVEELTRQASALQDQRVILTDVWRDLIITHEVAESQVKNTSPDPSS